MWKNKLFQLHFHTNGNSKTIYNCISIPMIQKVSASNNPKTLLKIKVPIKVSFISPNNLSRKDLERARLFLRFVSFHNLKSLFSF